MSSTKILLTILIGVAFVLLWVAWAKAQVQLLPGYTMRSKNVLCAPIAQVRKEMGNTGVRIGSGSMETKSGGVIVTDLWLTDTGMLIITETPDSLTMCIVSVTQDFEAVEFGPQTMNP